MDRYVNREIEPYLIRKLKSSGCVLVSGPKFAVKLLCVNTTLNQSHH